MKITVQKLLFTKIHDKYNCIKKYCRFQFKSGYSTTETTDAKQQELIHTAC